MTPCREGDWSGSDIRLLLHLEQIAPSVLCWLGSHLGKGHPGQMLTLKRAGIAMEAAQNMPSGVGENECSCGTVFMLAGYVTPTQSALGAKPSVGCPSVALRSAF